MERAYSFTFLFHGNDDSHNHETRTADHFRIPVVTSDWGERGIRYKGAIIWNSVLSNDTSGDVSEAVYVRLLRRLINENALP